MQPNQASNGLIRSVLLLATGPIDAGLPAHSPCAAPLCNSPAGAPCRLGRTALFLNNAGNTAGKQPRPASLPRGGSGGGSGAPPPPPTP